MNSPSAVSAPILNRLILAKYLLNRASDELSRTGPFACGIAVNALQDATEVLLRAIAEFHHLTVAHIEGFNPLVDKVAAIQGANLTHVPYLRRLNSSRVGFKHLGNLPDSTDVHSFRVALEGFFPQAIKDYFGLDYSELSLVSLVSHARAGNWLARAERSLDDGDFAESVKSSAIAAAIFNSFAGRAAGYFSFDVPMNAEIDRQTGSVLNQIMHRMMDHERMLSLLMYGIPLLDYYKFMAWTPEITLSEAKTFYIRQRFDGESILTGEVAKFCLSFVVDSILRMQELGVTHPRNAHLAVRRFKVKQEGAIIVWPESDTEKVEEIRIAEVGEELAAIASNRDTSDYVAIVQDDEVAYISASDVEEVSES